MGHGGIRFYDDNGLHVAVDAIVYFSEWEQVGFHTIRVLDYDSLELTAGIYDIENGYLGSFNILADAAPVPEPATIILLSTGLLGLVGASRKNETDSANLVKDMGAETTLLDPNIGQRSERFKKIPIKAG